LTTILHRHTSGVDGGLGAPSQEVKNEFLFCFVFVTFCQCCCPRALVLVSRRLETGIARSWSWNGGAAPSNFYTRYKALIAHTQMGMGFPPKKTFDRDNLKFGLKFSVLATITSGLVAVSSQNIFHTTCREPRGRDANICITFGRQAP